MRTWPGLAALCLLAAALAGCGETRPYTFYTLSAVAEEQGSTDRGRSSGLAVGVGPITLPKYLDRPQVVTRPTANRLNLAEFHRWGEPLNQMLSRTVSENLAANLGTDAVFELPRRRTPRLAAKQRRPAAVPRPGHPRDSARVLFPSRDFH